MGRKYERDLNRSLVFIGREIRVMRDERFERVRNFLKVKAVSLWFFFYCLLTGKGTKLRKQPLIR